MISIICPTYNSSRTIANVINSILSQKKYKHNFEIIERVMGLLLWTVGLLMLSGGFTDLSFWLLETFPFLGTLG